MDEWLLDMLDTYLISSSHLPETPWNPKIKSANGVQAPKLCVSGEPASVICIKDSSSKLLTEENRREQNANGQKTPSSNSDSETTRISRPSHLSCKSLALIKYIYKRYILRPALFSRRADG